MYALFLYLTLSISYLWHIRKSIKCVSLAHKRSPRRQWRWYCLTCVYIVIICCLRCSLFSSTSFFPFFASFRFASLHFVSILVFSSADKKVSVFSLPFCDDSVTPTYFAMRSVVAIVLTWTFWSSKQKRVKETKRSAEKVSLTFPIFVVSFVSLIFEWNIYSFCWQNKR